MFDSHLFNEQLSRFVCTQKQGLFYRFWPDL